MMEQCGNCRFSWRDPANDVNCRRHPPQVTVLMARNDSGEVVPTPYSTFPIVEADYWCAEWSAQSN